MTPTVLSSNNKNTVLMTDLLSFAAVALLFTKYYAQRRRSPHSNNHHSNHHSLTTSFELTLNEAEREQLYLLQNQNHWDCGWKVLACMQGIAGLVSSTPGGLVGATPCLS